MWGGGVCVEREGRGGWQSETSVPCVAHVVSARCLKLI